MSKIRDSSLLWQYGIAGCVTVPTNEALVRTFFVLLFLEFRTKAPGARTFAQFVRHRFGTPAHILCIGIYILTSIYIFTVNVGGTSDFKFYN